MEDSRVAIVSSGARKLFLQVWQDSNRKVTVHAVHGIQPIRAQFA